jgi:hypothetical protein
MHVLWWRLIAPLVCLGCQHAAAAEESVRFKTGRTFFDVLDRSGALAHEYTVKKGDMCAMSGIYCDKGDVVSMCVLFSACLRCVPTFG